MKRITLKNITMIFVIIASAVYIENSLGILNYVSETSNDLWSMWLVTMYVEGKIDTLIITDESDIVKKGRPLDRFLEYLRSGKQSAHLKVILKNTSSKTLQVKFGINFFDANDKLFLEKYPLPFTWLNGGEIDTLYDQYFSLPANQIEQINRYEIKVFYHKVEKRKRSFR